MSPSAYFSSPRSSKPNRKILEVVGDEDYQQSLFFSWFVEPSTRHDGHARTLPLLYLKKKKETARNLWAVEKLTRTVCVLRKRHREFAKDIIKAVFPDM